MKVKLSIKDITPLSLNNCYVFSTLNRHVRRFPSNEYKKYELLINEQLFNCKQNLNSIKNINSYFDENKHYLSCEYIFYYPILTKKSFRISKKSNDLSNSIKAIEDIIFKNLTCDDSSVCHLYASKIHSQKKLCEIIIQIKPIQLIQ